MKKQGALRVLKGSVVYGPMARHELDRLLASGRIQLTDQVSLWDSPWIPISEYVAGSSASAGASAVRPAASLASRTVSATGPKEGALRVLKGRRVYGSLARQQVTELLAAGRIDGDDLVCALDGPWMRIADFFAPPKSAAAPPVALDDEADPYESPLGVPEAVEVVEAEIADEVDPSDSEAALVAGVSSHMVGQVFQEPPELEDEWFVKVHGIHSAPLRKHHIKMLLAAREITLDSPARHPSWKSENWWPIRAIPELADAVP